MLARFFLRHAPAAADDLLQETRLRLERTRSAYDPSRPAEPWIWRIARIVLLEHRRARRHASLEAGPEPVAAADRDLDAAREAARELVWTCVRDLEEGRGLQRTFVVLHALEGVPHARLCDRFGAAESASKMRVRRGLEALEERLSVGRRAWPPEKRAAAAEGWAHVTDLAPQAEHGAILALFGRVGRALQLELGIGGAAPFDEAAVERLNVKMRAAGFPA